MLIVDPATQWSAYRLQLYKARENDIVVPFAPSKQVVPSEKQKVEF